MTTHSIDGRYTISEHPQGSLEWRKARAGKATGSRADDMLARLKNGDWGASREGYKYELAIERITGEPYEQGYQSADMLWGTNMEPFGRMAYERVTGTIVEEAGFAELVGVMAGSSVDGFIDEDGILEVKCPKTHTHIKYLLAGVPPPEYIPQYTHNLWVTGRRWADCVSYDPRVPEKLQLLVVRFEPPQELIDAHGLEVLKFIEEVDALEQKLRDRMK